MMIGLGMHERDDPEAGVLEVRGDLDEVHFGEDRFAAKKLLVEYRQQEEVVERAERAQWRHDFHQLVLVHFWYVAVCQQFQQVDILPIV